MFKNVGERSIAKNYRTVNLLSVATKVFVKLANNNVINNIGKQGFRSSRSTSDLLTVVSDRIAWDINRSEATGTVAPGISKAFDTVWHAERILFSVIDGFEWFWMESLDKKIQLG